jgi:hypothetical protein
MPSLPAGIDIHEDVLKFWPDNENLNWWGFALAILITLRA